jgi:hypothetical protein
MMALENWKPAASTATSLGASALQGSEHVGELVRLGDNLRNVGV